jgi:hypothetical protein
MGKGHRRRRLRQPVNDRRGGGRPACRFPRHLAACLRDKPMLNRKERVGLTTKNAKREGDRKLFPEPGNRSGSRNFAILAFFAVNWISSRL